MPTTVNLPNGEVVNFPDGVSEDEMREAVEGRLKKNPGAADKSPGALKTFGEHAASSIAPGAAFMAGSIPGAKAGAALGAMVPGLGETGLSEAVGAFVGGLVTGGISSWAAYKAQHSLLKSVSPSFTKKMDEQLESGAEAHPFAAIAGDVAGNIPSAELTLPKVAEAPFRAALGATVGGVMPFAQGRTPTKTDIAEGALFGTVFGRSRFESILPRASAAAKAAGVKLPPKGEPNAVTERPPVSPAVPAAEAAAPATPTSPPETGQPPTPTAVNIVQDETAATGSRYVHAIVDGQPWEVRLSTHEPGQTRGGNSRQGRKALQTSTGKEFPYELDWRVDAPEKVTPEEIHKVVKSVATPDFIAEEGNLAQVHGHKKPQIANFDPNTGKTSYSPVNPVPAQEEVPIADQPVNNPVGLSDEHQSMLDLAANEGGHKVRVVSEPLREGDPFARKIATIDRETGEILINPSELGKWLDSVPEANRKAAMRSLLGEEAIHLATADKDALSYHDAATGLERAAAQQIYGGKGGTALSPLMLGHEMLRQRMQQLARMGVREAVEASGREKWTVKGLLLLNDVVRTARETLGTKASKEQRGILDRIQENLDAALLMKSVSSPAAQRKGLGQEHDTEEGREGFVKMPTEGVWGQGIEPANEHRTSIKQPIMKFAEDADIYQIRDKVAAAARANGWDETKARDFARRMFPKREAPGATRKGQEEKTPEFFLPPITEPVERPSASELGVLPERKIPPEQALKTDTILWNKPNAWRRLTGMVDTTKPYSLGKLLTEGARASETDPVSATRRLVALEKNGKVEVVSVYPVAKDGARAVDPAYARAGKARPNVPIESLLQEGYKPIVSMLRTDPVQNFYRHFDSVQQFEETVGKPADDQWANVRGYEPQTAATQASSFGEGEEITNAEAGALHDHFIEHDTLDKAVDAIVSSPSKQQFRSAIGKIINRVMASIPNLTREEATGIAAKYLYEQAHNAEHRSDYVKDLLAEYGQESPESSRGETVHEATVGEVQQPEGDTADEPVGGIRQNIDVEAEPVGESPYDPDLSLLRQGQDSPGAIRKFATDQARLVKDEVKDVVTGKKIYDSLARTIDAAGNLTNKAARGEEVNIRLASASEPKSFGAKISQFMELVRGNKDVLAAANALVQSGFDRSKLPTYRLMVQEGDTKANDLAKTGGWRKKRIAAAWLRSNAELLKELDYAEKHWDDPELQETARRMGTALHQQWQREADAGIDVRKDENYDPQRYDASIWNEHSIIFKLLAEDEKVLGKRFGEKRSFDSYYQAAGEGPFIPVTRDGASLVSHRVRQGMSKIERNAWTEGLQSIKMSDGKPLAKPVTYERVNPTPQTVPQKIATGALATTHAAPDMRMRPSPSDDPSYSLADIGGQHIWVHDDAKSMINALTKPSIIQDVPILKSALRFEQQLKHGLLLGDFFHMGRMLYYALSIMGKNAAYKGGISALDIKPENLNEAVRKGVIGQDDADWAREKIKYGNARITRQQLVVKFIKAGANLGKIQDALYKDLITDLTPAAGPVRRGLHRVLDPSFGAYNRFLFDKLTRGLMTESNVREFERQHAANPNANPDALVKDISRDVNNYFGNIGKQGWVKSATMKDLQRMFILAPDWVEGLIKKEGVAYSRLSGASKLAGKRQGLSALGTTGRGIGRGLTFMFGLTQAINLITRQQPTWKNEEDGHKFDAFIPGIGKNNEGFWFSPFSMFNEISHDTWRYALSDKTTLQAIDQVAGNKESPLTRAVIIALVGATSSGQRFTSSASQLNESAKQLAPLPLTFGKIGQFAGHAIAPGVVPPVPSQQLIRQGISSLGFKVEPKLNAAQEVSRVADKFSRANGFKKDTGWQQVPTDEPSYSKLRSALRTGDEAEAKRVYNALQKSHTDRQIFKAMKLAKNRPFTGSKAGESAFIRSLDDRQLKDYFAALQQRDSEYQAFEDFVMRQP